MRVSASVSATQRPVASARAAPDRGGPARARRWGGHAGRAGRRIEVPEDLSDHLGQLPARERQRVLQALEEQGREHEWTKERRRAHKEARLQANRGPLRIISGAHSGKRLWVPDDPRTRPMMARVRGAVFDMLTARGCLKPTPGPGGVPRLRWLDLYAGTGAVGIEAASRGATDVTFVEADPLVRVEEFLLSTERRPVGQFDCVSICPPYEQASYPEIFRLVERSAILHEGSHVLVEYPRKGAGDIVGQIGPITRLVERAYGRTVLALYGPPLPREADPLVEVERLVAEFRHQAA